jgi:hypothetical protein
LYHLKLRCFVVIHVKEKVAFSDTSNGTEALNRRRTRGGYTIAG